MRLLAALPLLLGVAAVVIYGWRLDVTNERLRADTLAQAAMRAEQLAAAVGGQTEATIRTADFAVRHLRDEYAEGRNIEEEVRTTYDALPPNALTQIGVIDADGYLAWSSVGVRGRIYLGDREHFKVHLGRDDDRLFISHPVLGRASGVWSIQFSRPIRHKGSFAGVMVVSLAPQFLISSHVLALGDRDAVSLFKPDGAYLARAPNLADALGRSVPADRPFVGADAPARGVLRIAAAFDNVRRTYAWRRLDGYPVVVNVGLDEAAVLEPVEREIAASLWRRNVGSAVVLALALGVAALLLRAARQQLVLMANISDMVEAEESLRLAQSVFEVAGEGIMVTDADNRIIAVNPAFSQLTGYVAAEAIGQTPTLLASGSYDAAFYAAMWQRLARDGRWEGEITNRHRDGRDFVVWLRITVVPERPGHGRRYVALFSDITDRKREADAVWHQANFDPLTGLPNRKLLEDRLQRAIAQSHRKSTTVALLFVDLDRFKPVNDAHGHAAGDELLRQVARRLEHCLRDEDTVARLGGDEFIVVLPDLRIAEAPAKAADKIVAVLSEPYRLGECFVEISCSIGIALFPRDADNAAALIARADTAMYAAKQAGRSTWRTAQ